MSSTAPVTAARRNILIVEDHLQFRAMLVQLVNSEPGLSVCGEADNVQDALTLIEATHPDAAILDLALKGSNGLELIVGLRARDLPLPVLVLSMHTERSCAERALRAGAQGYVSKEESPAEAVQALRAVLAGRIYVSRRLSGTMQGRLSYEAQPMPPSVMDLLSDREKEVFQLIGRGLTSREIAEQLNLASTTVDSYRARVKEKLGIKNAAQLYQRAAQWVTERSL